MAAHGSTPRIAGARQFLAADGGHAGTIGGGASEARVLDLARETLADGEPRTFCADLRGRPGDVREGICGGTMQIWITRLDGRRHQALVQKIADQLLAGRRLTVCTRLDGVDPLALEATQGGFTDMLDPAPCLLIVGAGHIGRSLARLAAELGFTVAVQDERPEWLAATAFPKGCRLEPDLAAATHALASWEGDRFAALVTRGFSQDIAALDALGAVPSLAYVGLLGSRKRVATVLSAQRATGRPAPDAAILHAPIGLEIGAETPEEIAVSIAAELIRIRRSQREAAVRSSS